MAGFFARLLRRSVAGLPDWIEADELQQRIVAGEPLLLLDVRNPEEFAGPLGHIAGAVNLPLPELPARLAELAADRRPIVTVCLTDKRSARAATALAAAGHRKVTVLRGGMERWCRDGRASRA